MAKKMVIESVVEDSKDVVITSNSVINFELNAEIVAGTLTSNAKELSTKVKKELEKYSVEKYMNNPDAAKTDKALLNKVKESVSAKRKEIAKAWNLPLEEFLEEMKTLEKAINEASDKLNSIVKEADDTEKKDKENKIREYWNTLQFNLIPIDKIFNPRWLNKTYKLEQVMLDCEAAIEKITSELSTIKSMADEDNEILQSFYLDTLDLNSTLQKGNQLKANRAVLNNVETIDKPVINALVEEKIIPVANLPKEIKQEIHSSIELMTFTLKLIGPKEAMLELRRFIDSKGIKYEKLEG